MDKQYLNLTYNSYSCKIKGYKNYQERFLGLAKGRLIDLMNEEVKDDYLNELVRELRFKLNQNLGLLEKRTLDKINSLNEIRMKEKEKILLQILLETNTEKIFSLLENVNKLGTASLTTSLVYSENKNSIELKVIDDNLKVEEYIMLEFPSNFLKENNYTCLVALFVILVHLIDTILINPFTTNEKITKKGESLTKD